MFYREEIGDSIGLGRQEDVDRIELPILGMQIRVVRARYDVSAIPAFGDSLLGGGAMNRLHGANHSQYNCAPLTGTHHRQMWLLA
jgi:hypothetical protein